MLEAPQIVDVPLQHTAYIHLTIPRSSIQKEMGPAIEEVVSTLREQSITPEGPLFAHHLRMDPDSFDMEIGVPVKEAATPRGRLRAGHIPASRVVRSIYTGPYEGLHDAWSELNDWIRAEGLTMAPNLWEVYLQGPESTPDPAEWRTELNRPIIT
jgi:effector-binding domain-containing protein